MPCATEGQRPITEWIDMLDRKRYACYTNNTKWSELREAMLGLYPKAPSFRIKTLNWIGEA
jgi:hypothetical protein